MRRPSRLARVDAALRCPTRLLDFSHSVYVAAFFAVERRLADAAIWGVNLFALMSRKPDVWKDRIDVVNRQQVALANDVIQRKRRVAPDVLNVEPERMHERLAVQQGLFLFPCDITSSFETNLAAALNVEADFLRKVRTQRWRTGELFHLGFRYATNDQNRSSAKPIYGRHEELGRHERDSGDAVSRT
jgi:FRG domain